MYGRDISKTWQLINEISNYKRKTKTSIKSIVDKDGNTLSDHISIADCFNNHFSSVGSVMAQKFDGIDSSRVKNPMSYLSNDVKNSLFLSLPTAHEIAKIIRKLNVKKSFGYDLISNKIVQVTHETISSYLEVLFHKCLKEGVFPDSFKIAQVIPLFKGGDRQDLNCYRPISLLPTISKIFERILATRVINFFTKFKLFFLMTNLALDQNFALNMLLLIFMAD